MIAHSCFPRIETDFNSSTQDSSIKEHYHHVTQQVVKKILRKHFPAAVDDEQINYEILKESFYSSLPLFTSTEIEKAPSNLSFYLLTKYRMNAFRFFFDMLSSWLIPGHRLDVTLFHGVDLWLPDLDDEKYTLVEVMLKIHSDYELQEIERNMPILQTEIRLGVGSAYYARRILETKGLVADQKTALIQEQIAYLSKRFPDHFDRDVFQEMQHVLVLCQDSFKSERESRHLSRIISLNYLYRKKLRELVNIAPERRHLHLKLFNARVRLPTMTKKVLGILVGINFMSDKEIFEDRHLLKAIQNYLPNVKLVEGSFFSHRPVLEEVGTVYLEIEKIDRTAFTQEEILRLRNDLPDDLKDRIEHMMHPVFMPRNEEEIMRNIVALSNQIDTLQTIPQVIISFDEQTYSHLYFTIIHVRFTKDNNLKIEKIFRSADTFLEYIHDFSKVVGYLRKKYPKEATVFQVKLPKDMFLRDDHSIDLYKARQVVVAELENVLGKFRDYNGGMISKQNELLCNVRGLLAEEGIYNDLLLENFFYSITPANMRSVFEASSLKKLFVQMLDTLEQGFLSGEHYVLSIDRELDSIYVIIISDFPGVKEEAKRALSNLNILSMELATIYVTASGVPCLGFIYCCDDPYKQEHFCQTIRHTLESWSTCHMN